MHPDGKFEANLLPGLYTLRLVRVTIPNSTEETKNPQPMLLHLLARQDLEISGKDVYGVLILISPPFTIDGHVTVENQPNQAVTGGEVKLEAIDPIAPAGSLVARIHQDGSFSIPDADAVSYAIRYSPPAGMYVQSIDLKRTGRLIALPRPFQYSGRHNDDHVDYRAGFADRLSATRLHHI